MTIFGAGMQARDREPVASVVPSLPPLSIAPGRFAGQSVVEELLRQHENRPPQSRLARALGAAPLDANELSWLRAAQAEMIVGDILTRLPDDYTVYHSLPIRSTAFWVDHLVVGPGGVFSINAKTHWDRDLNGSPRSIPIGNHAMPYLRDARFESAQITALLAKVMPEAAVVEPLIVLVNPHKILLNRKPNAVTVIDSPRLRRWIVARPRTFSPEQQAAVTALIDAPATWRAAITPLAPVHLHARFTALEQQVAAARIRRTTFTVLAAAAAATLLAALTSPLIVAAVEYLAVR
ncbi:nuclease-related domain-containing protein [Cryobacterium suzukii]|nr:nuclease-related domain-containing protein [Cryobacterium suzukii]